MLIRTDAAGCTHDVLDWLTAQRRSYSVRFTLPEATAPLPMKIPESVWAPPYDADGQVSEDAWGAEPTDLHDLSGWPKGMRAIAREERPHPGAQLRITDVDGHRVTALATTTRTGGPGSPLAHLELGHRRRARAEDRMRAARRTPA